MKRTVCVLVLGLTLGCAGSRKPAVTLEQPFDAAPTPNPRADTVIPPFCETMPLPAYPDVSEDARPELVTVRVDFVIDTEGRAKHVKVGAVEPSDSDEPYLHSTALAMQLLHCEPAWRLPAREGDEREPLDYRTSLIYRFHRDGHSVVAGE